MTSYSFADELPLGGSAAPLLTTAIALSYPVSLADLARHAGVSRFAAARAAPDLLQRGLLVLDDYEEYVFNHEHDLAPLLRSLAWRFSGVSRPAADERSGVPRTLGWQDDFHYRRWIPKVFQTRDRPQLESTAEDGPSLVGARDAHSWLGRTLPELRRYERQAQEVHYQWGNERLRDVIHQTLHFGSAVSEAQRTLAVDCAPTVQAGGDPWQTHVPAATWAKATYLVSAEASDVLRVVQILNTACRVGGHVNTLRDQALSALSDVNYAGQESQFREVWLQTALSKASEAEALWADDSYGPYKRIGGIPRPRDVGTAGDQVLGVRLLHTAEMLAGKVDEMASHPGFTRWIEANRAATSDVSLLRAIPENALRGSRVDQTSSPEAGSGPYLVSDSD